jgi:predicted Fe-Mo cluster-binding NifX family protein
MRLGIPVWRGHVSPVFDVAATLLVIDVEDALEVGRYVVPLGRPSEAARAQQLAAMGVHVLACGVISRPLERMLTAAGIRVVSLVSGPIERVAASLIAGSQVPSDCLMPGHGQPRVRGRS